MRRREAIAALVGERGDVITITTEQAIGAWRAAVPEPANEIPDHLDIVGCMGSASTIGLGIALSRPERRVIVVDGDGSLLMQLGSLVTIAGAAPPNYYHFVFDNGVYETTGNQSLPARVDFCGLARLGIAREGGPIRWPKVKMADQVQALRERLAATP